MEFKQWLEREVMVPVQGADQKDDYDCGPGALRGIAKLFGHDKSQNDMIRMTDAGKRKGTHPEDLVKAARKMGMNAVMKENMTLELLLKQLKLGRPVICAVQAWGDKKDYHKLEDGHYLVAIGFSTSKKEIWFEDPSIHDGKRGRMPFDQFMQRWFDKEAYVKPGEKVKPHLGIIVWDNKQVNPDYETTAKRIP